MLYVQVWEVPAILIVSAFADGESNKANSAIEAGSKNPKAIAENTVRRSSFISANGSECGKAKTAPQGRGSTDAAGVEAIQE